MWWKILLMLLILCFLIGLFIGNYFFNITLKRANTWFKSRGDATVNKGARPSPQVKTAEKTMAKQYASAEKFWDKHTIATPTISAFDGLQLYGRVIQSLPKSKKWAICMHGYRSGAFRDCAYPVVKFSEMGFNALAPDQRAHGNSEGKYIGMGWDERRDVQAWIDYLINEYNASEILLYGGSMGAATVLNTSGELMPKQVKAIIADCGYTSAADQFSYILKNSMRLPKKPIMFFANLITRIRAGYSLYQDAPKKQLTKNILPVLFFHGLADNFIPFTMSATNAFATKGARHIVFIDHATHFTSYGYDPDLYFSTVKNFLEKYFI